MTSYICTAVVRNFYRKEKEKEKITLKKILNEFEIYIGTVVFLALTVLLTIQVVSRYVFKH